MQGEWRAWERETMAGERDREGERGREEGERQKERERKERGVG